MKKRIQYIGALGLLFISSIAYSQIKEEKLILNRKRVPEVKKIEKKKSSAEVIKDYPKEEKSLNPVRYQITDVPASSDFETSTIGGEDVAPIMKNDFYNNYIRVGIGNYGKILGDGFASYAIDDKNEIGIDAHYLSTTGLKKDYTWDSDQRQFGVSAFINHYADKGKWNLTGKYNGSKQNYYGIYALDYNGATDFDLEQRVNVFGIQGSYDHYSNHILDKVSLEASFLKDHFEASESKINFGVDLAEKDIYLSRDYSLDGSLGFGLENITTDFEIQDKNQNKYTKLNVTPDVKFRKDNFYISIGSAFSYLNHEFNNATATNWTRNGKFYWFPKAEVQYETSSEFKIFGGVDGGLNLNHYQSFLAENPFVLSNQVLKPTKTKYRFYGGLRGDWEETFKYEVSVNYSQMNDIMFFKGNTIFDNNVAANRMAYDYANTFSAAYDNGSLLQIKAEANYFPLENLMFDGEVKFNQYQLDNHAEILNVPFVEASLGAKYRLLDNKLLLGAKAFVSSDYTANAHELSTIYNPLTSQFEYESKEKDNEKIGGYFDINLSAEYNIYKNFSIFVIGNNLTNQKYETFKGYKALGAQVLGGIKIQF